MPNLGVPELIIIAIVILVLFGWKKLPDAARSVGRSMRIFKSEVNEMKKESEDAPAATKAPGEITAQQPQQPNITIETSEDKNKAS